jgi:uncharacterized protein YgiM (DUF1202 family)
MRNAEWKSSVALRILHGFYTMFGARSKRGIKVWWRACGLGVLFGMATAAWLYAADIRYVNSPETPLNVRRGPGTEHAVVARLPHGTRVVLRERLGLWYRIALPDEQTEGWVLQRYLTTDTPGDAQVQVDMSVEAERRRFDRLQRKGIIDVHRYGATLRMTINPLIWRRLTSTQQVNFLQRARRLFAVTSVEMHDQRNATLLARLTATGQVETYETPQQPSADIVPHPQTGERR